MTFDFKKYKLREERSQEIFENEIKPDIFKDAQSSDKPIAIIIAGQPGAGKSASVTNAENELKDKGGCVMVDGDSLRDYHPNYETLLKEDDKTAALYTNLDMGQWVKKSVQEAKEQRLNLVIDGIGRNAENAANAINKLQKDGYEVELRALAVSPTLSEQGCLLRYERQKSDREGGRMVPQEIHKDGCDAIVNISNHIEQEKLVDKISVYRRGGDMLYSNELQNGQWINKPQVSKIIQDERSRPMTTDELKRFKENNQKIISLMDKRNANPDEYDRVNVLIKQEHKFEKAEMVKNLADKLTDRASTPEEKKILQDAIAKEVDRRNALGTLPKVQVYDSKAPSKIQSQSPQQDLGKELKKLDKER